MPLSEGSSDERDALVLFLAEIEGSDPEAHGESLWNSLLAREADGYVTATFYPPLPDA